MTEGHKLTATGSKSDGNSGKFTAIAESEKVVCATKPFVKPHFNFITRLFAGIFDHAFLEITILNFFSFLIFHVWKMYGCF